MTVVISQEKKDICKYWALINIVYRYAMKDCMVTTARHYARVVKLIFLKIIIVLPVQIHLLIVLNVME